MLFRSACALGTGVLAVTLRTLDRLGAGDRASASAAIPASAPPSPSTSAPRSSIPVANVAPTRAFAWGLAGYGCFGAGYIGYMTFVIALLRQQGASSARLTLFYSLLGLACMLSSRLWAGLLDRWRGGQPQAVLNALLGVATVLPLIGASGAWGSVLGLVSGVMFGGVFLSVVASTTALVRHNLPPSQWAAGISAFTIVFAFGQIVGPTVVGWLSDGPGGLSRGLVASAAMLWLGAVLAWRQRPLG